MKTTIRLALFLIAYCVNANIAQATEHHSGHVGGGGGGARNSDSNCLKPQLTNFLPANLAMVTPGAAFSFWAVNVSKPKHIEVTVKTIPVAVTVEDKDSYYLVKGHLPTELVNTAARINIKVNTPIAKCNAENGWLVKISE